MVKQIEATESAEQIAVKQWWNLQYPKQTKLLFHIPNGGLRDKVTSAKLKREGVEPGVADLFLAVPFGGYHGMFIEMKRKKSGRQSKEQLGFQELVEKQGYLYVVAHGAGEAISKIQEYLRGGIVTDTSWFRPRPNTRPIARGQGRFDDALEKIRAMQKTVMEQSKPEEDLITTKLVCSIMGISRPTVYKLVQKGLLRGTNVGQKWLISKQSIIDLLEAKEDALFDRYGNFAMAQASNECVE